MIHLAHIVEVIRLDRRLKQNKINKDFVSLTSLGEITYEEFHIIHFTILTHTL